MMKPNNTVEPLEITLTLGSTGANNVQVLNPTLSHVVNHPMDELEWLFDVEPALLNPFDSATVVEFTPMPKTPSASSRPI